MSLVLMDIDESEEEKEKLEMSLRSASMAMRNEIANLGHVYPHELRDFQTSIPVQEENAHLFGVCNFPYKQGHLSGHKGNIKFSPHGCWINWSMSIARNGHSRGLTARAICRWAPTLAQKQDGDSGFVKNYEYRTWCYVMATDKEFENDLKNRMKVRLRDLAERLSFEEKEFDS